MLVFIARRLFNLVPILWVVTVIIFLLIWLQPGDVVDALCGLGCSPSESRALRAQYGLDQPFHIQYLTWISGVVTRLDFGYSVRHNMPALQALVGEGRLFYTFLLLTTSMLISWFIAVPIGIYSATHKYSFSDHLFTFLALVGLSIPNFVMGIFFIWLIVGVVKPQTFSLQGEYKEFFSCIGGFRCPAYESNVWSLPSMLNFLWHFLPPVLILSAANIAQIVRYMRANLLDILEMHYIQTARSKGLHERRVIWKHAVRNAINPLISMLGFWIPYMLEGAIVVAIVFNLPQVEKSFFEAIENRESAVVATGLFMFSIVLVLGNLLADILLAIADPKIRYT